MERRAKALAERVTSDPMESDESRVRRAFLLLFGRTANDRELTMALGFLRPVEGTPEKKQGPSRWEQLAQVLLGTNEFSYVD
jgi:hypothetical protein